MSGIVSNTTMTTMLTPSTLTMNNFTIFSPIPSSMPGEDKISLPTLTDTLTSHFVVSILERYWVTKMEICLEKLMKNTPSLNLFRKALKLEQEEICMQSLQLILMSMEVGETFLLETKEKLLNRTCVEEPIDSKDIDSLSPTSIEELWQELVSTSWCATQVVPILNTFPRKVLNG